MSTASNATDMIASDFALTMEGKLAPDLISETIELLKSQAQSYSAKCTVASLIFYQKINVEITAGGGKTFDGHSGGLAIAGGGVMFGSVYTSDLGRLYRETHSFQFTAATVYVSVIFFDKSNKPLGTFQGGGVSNIQGTGGGTGKWS